MHSQIDPPGSKGFFNFFGEHPFGADHRERDVGNLVASGVYDLDLDFVSAPTQQRRNMVGLPERELRTAGTDAELGHQWRVPTSLLEASLFAVLPASFSRKLNSRRTTSTTVVASDSLAALFNVVIGVCITLLMIPRVSASTAISCSGVICPSRPRTRSISACRIVSR